MKVKYLFNLIELTVYIVTINMTCRSKCEV